MGPVPTDPSACTGNYCRTPRSPQPCSAESTHQFLDLQRGRSYLWLAARYRDGSHCLVHTIAHIVVHVGELYQPSLPGRGCELAVVLGLALDLGFPHVFG